jgi:metal-dependent HD superfamily phosphatase/phosphodiesterase
MGSVRTASAKKGLTIAQPDEGAHELKVSTKGNTKLTSLLEEVNKDQELQQFWEAANVNAVRRLGMSDHGPVHIQIVANACVRILRLLVAADVSPSVVTDHGMTDEDAEVVVVLSAFLHDVGMAAHRDNHENISLILGYPKARQLLSPLYEEPTLTTMVSEVLHAIIAHRWDVQPLSLEAGVLKVADALDMTQGRSRIPFESGEVNIHSVSAQAIEEVRIEKGEQLPVRVDILLNNSAGIFQVDELLKRKLANSTLAPYVEVVAHLETEKERKILEIHKF